MRKEETEGKILGNGDVIRKVDFLQMQVRPQDLEAIRSWMIKEPSLPNTFDDLMLRKFVFSCDGSLERTKRCIEEFCNRRASMSELYCDRDPLAKKIQNVFAITNVAMYTAGTDEILIHQLHSVPDDFEFYDAIKAFTIQCDHWVQLPADPLPNNHLIIFDLKAITLRLVAKSNVFYFQKFLIYLLESMPVRLKQVHAVNCPSYVDYLYSMIKPALPDYLCNMIHFHTDNKSLHKHINKKYLPKDYGGECPSLEDVSTYWINDICDKRKLYLNDYYWKADLSKKIKSNSGVEEIMSGSFRSLAVD